MVVGTTCDVLDGLQFLKGEAVPVPAPGRVTVIELWAKWCSPCRQIFPHLTSIYNAKKASGLTVVGISIEDDPSLADFIAAEGDRMGYTVAVDKKGVTQGLMQRAGASGIPHAFVVDHTGVIVFSGHPAQPEFEQVIDKALAELSLPEKQALPLVAASIKELQAMPVKALKQILKERKLSIAGLSEKQDLVDMIDKQCRTVTYYA